MLNTSRIKMRTGELDMANSENKQHVHVENMDRYLADGQSVHDLNGEDVGEVKMFSSAAGYLMVTGGAFGEKSLYIPFRLIGNVDPGRVNLTETKKTLEADYTQPPETRLVMETRLIAGPGGKLRPETRQVQVLESSTGDLPVKINSTNVDELASSIAVGMAVYDVDGLRLGDITQYDITRALMVVEKGILKPKVVLIPFSDIDSISLDHLSVYLSMPKDAVVKEHGLPIKLA
jgi:ribosomal 30S subunit maturation factor RimM